MQLLHCEINFITQLIQVQQKIKIWETQFSKKPVRFHIQFKIQKLTKSVILDVRMKTSQITQKLMILLISINGLKKKRKT